MDPKKFVRALVGTYHEIRHAVQYLRLRNGSGEFAKALAYDEMGKRGSLSYYMENYDGPCELDAQAFAVRQAYVFCAAHFGEETANRLICDYMNDRVKDKLPLAPDGDKLYDDAFEAMADLEARAEASYHAKRTYTSAGRAGKDDRFGSYMYGDDEMIAIFNGVEDGMLQDRFAAAVERDRAGLLGPDGACPHVRTLDLIDVHVELEAEYERLHGSLDDLPLPREDGGPGRP